MIEVNLQMTMKITATVSVVGTLESVNLSWQMGTTSFKNYTPVYLIYFKHSDAAVGQTINKVREMYVKTSSDQRLDRCVGGICILLRIDWIK